MNLFKEYNASDFRVSFAIDRLHHAEPSVTHSQHDGGFHLHTSRAYPSATINQGRTG